MLVTLHDTHIVKKLPPQRKYNDAQRIAYTGVILMGVRSILTGADDLQTDADGFFDEHFGRLRMGALGTILADDCVCRFFHRLCRSSCDYRLE